MPIVPIINPLNRSRFDFVNKPTIPTTPPSISLTSPQAGSYVLGQSVGPVDLDAITTKGTYDIQSVDFRRNGAVINTIDPATPGGGNESYSDAGPFTTAQSWNAIVTDTNGLTGTSNTVSISFSNYFYRGDDPNETIDETLIEALENNDTRTSYTGVYAFPAETGSYKYFARPTRLGQPSDPTVDFIDNDTNFAVPFQLQGTVSVTNTYGYTEDYYVYRSVNVLGGAMNIRVQP